MLKTINSTVKFPPWKENAEGQVNHKKLHKMFETEQNLSSTKVKESKMKNV